MHYQEHLTKYHLLSPLTTKRAGEVARQLLKIFVDFGASYVLQSMAGSSLQKLSVNSQRCGLNYFSLMEGPVIPKVRELLKGATLP
jgi:hypothetical protein